MVDVQWNLHCPPTLYNGHPATTTNRVLLRTLSFRNHSTYSGHLSRHGEGNVPWRDLWERTNCADIFMVAVIYCRCLILNPRRPPPKPRPPTPSSGKKRTVPKQDKKTLTSFTKSVTGVGVGVGVHCTPNTNFNYYRSGFSKQAVERVRSEESNQNYVSCTFSSFVYSVL